MEEIYHYKRRTGFVIENSGQKWGDYRKKITEFLDIKQYKEKLYNASFKKYYATYFGHGLLLEFHEKKKRHYMDYNLHDYRLIPVAKNEYAIEGHPGIKKFYTYGGKRKFKLMQDQNHMKAGTIFEEYKKYPVTEADLQKYCGDYRCEPENLDRKIFLDKGSLHYYWSDSKAQCRLLPIGKNKFAKLGGPENTVTFKKVKGTWHFKVWDKGSKSDAVFVKKEK